MDYERYVCIEVIYLNVQFDTLSLEFIKMNFHFIILVLFLESALHSALAILYKSITDLLTYYSFNLPSFTTIVIVRHIIKCLVWGWCAGLWLRVGSIISWGYRLTVFILRCIFTRWGACLTLSLSLLALVTRFEWRLGVTLALSQFLNFLRILRNFC